MTKTDETYQSYQYLESFPLRLRQLRQQRNVSAREMSLALGQNAGYINRLENKKGYPSLPGLFFICEYLQISPTEFFDDTNRFPVALHALMNGQKWTSCNPCKKNTISIM